MQIKMGQTARKTQLIKTCMEITLMTQLKSKMGKSTIRNKANISLKKMKNCKKLVKAIKGKAMWEDLIALNTWPLTRVKQTQEYRSC